MGARKLSQSVVTVNAGMEASGIEAIGPAASGQDRSSAQPNLVALHAAIWAAVGKVAEKENRRDDLPDGFTGKVEMYIAAKIAGSVYRQGFTADLSVGHASTRASSSLPNTGAIVGHILALLNEKTREAVLRDLPAVYASNAGELPEVPEEISAAADGLLAKLRATKSQAVRGSVSCKYQQDQPALGIVG